MRTRLCSKLGFLVCDVQEWKGDSKPLTRAESSFLVTPRNVWTDVQVLVRAHVWVLSLLSYLDKEEVQGTTFYSRRTSLSFATAFGQQILVRGCCGFIVQLELEGLKQSSINAQLISNCYTVSVA